MRIWDVATSRELIAVNGHGEGSALFVAFSHDGRAPLGLYFGTRAGQVFASDDEGEGWQSIAEYLPAVLCVRAAFVG